MRLGGAKQKAFFSGKNKTKRNKKNCSVPDSISLSIHFSPEAPELWSVGGGGSFKTYRADEEIKSCFSNRITEIETSQREGGEIY